MIAGAQSGRPKFLTERSVFGLECLLLVRRLSDVQMQRLLYVGKTEGFALINASASPMLSESEAPWVASEMRRALRETAH